MSTTGARNHARRARSEHTAEGKLDELSKAIEELANALDEIEKRVTRTEAHAANAAHR
jgi:hypothetical protein